MGLNIAAAAQREEVKIPDFTINGETHGFSFEVGLLTSSQFYDLTRPENAARDVRDVITFEEIAGLFYEWDSATGVFDNVDTGKKEACTKAHVLDFIEGVPEGPPLMTGALIRAYAQRLAKNSEASSSTTGTTGRTTAKAARRPKKRRKK